MLSRSLRSALLARWHTTAARATADSNGVYARTFPSMQGGDVVLSFPPCVEGVVINTVWGETVTVEASHDGELGGGGPDAGGGMDAGDVVTVDATVAPLRVELSMEAVATVPGEAAASPLRRVTVEVPQKVNSLTVTSASGVHITGKLEGDLAVAVAEGDIEVTKVRGELVSLETGAGRVVVSQVVEGGMTIRGYALEAKMLMGPIVDVALASPASPGTTATGGWGGISMDALYADKAILASHGEAVQLGTVQGNVDVDTAGGDLSVAGIDGSISAQTGIGAARVQFDVPRASSDVRSTTGNIDITLRPSNNVDVCLRGDAPDSSVDVAAELEGVFKVRDSNHVEGQLTPSADAVQPQKGGPASGKVRQFASAEDYQWDSSMTRTNLQEPKGATLAQAHINATTGAGRISMAVLDWMAALRLKHLGSAAAPIFEPPSAEVRPRMADRS
jgi:hypothetical protein